jgi:hypothetical protein
VEEMVISRFEEGSVWCFAEEGWSWFVFFGYPELGVGREKAKWHGAIQRLFRFFVKPPFPRDGLSIVVIILETLEPSPA